MCNLYEHILNNERMLEDCQKRECPPHPSLSLSPFTLSLPLLSSYSVTPRQLSAHVQFWHLSHPTLTYKHTRTDSLIDSLVEADMVLEKEAVQTVATWLPVPSLAAVLKYSCFCWSFREKSSVEQEIKEKEESVRQRTNEVEVRGVCFVREQYSSIRRCKM